ncbi:helix-turn-helix transcriptional regulator [Methylobacterium nodulans]|uniref:Transcriptional regulator, LuxR family n=1 Tax=Methylobacterium nodulans (strain LMG 21967 / CNCM I-2342 / ORS 2060) TaxID=460265 RepID=B8IR54_METNO|nr:LuxR family transcriptional regulator [Methylobacterium nodulans]ACL56756.1 transcriptional regulator, LuxR family [Methylobacterium nodulans ORS 2060]
MSSKSLDLSRELLQSIHRTATPENVRDQLLKKLAGVGVEHVLLATLRICDAVPCDRRPTVFIGTYPDEWARRYYARNYILHDPVVRGVAERASGFAWTDPDLIASDDREARRVLDEAGEFGLHEGFTLPLLTLEGDTAGVSFVGERLDLSPAVRGMLTLVGTYALGQVLLLANGQAEALSEPLSPRERESLQWAADGKSDWEIGEAMGISEHGAIRHLRAVRRKLGTTSRAHAVALGLRLGIIS